MYAYASFSPVNLIDPSGLAPHDKFAFQVAKYTNKALKRAMRKFRKNIADHEGAILDPCQKLAKQHHEHELRIFEAQLKIIEGEAAKRGLLTAGAGITFAEDMTAEEAEENTSSWFDWFDPWLAPGTAY